MKQARSGQKVANSLVAVSSAAVMAVYAAGYTRTRAAADQFEGQSAERRASTPRTSRGNAARAPAPEKGLSGETQPVAGSRQSARTETQDAPTATTPSPAEASAATNTSAPTVIAKSFEPAAPAPEHKVEVASATPATATPAPPPPPAPPTNPAAAPWKDGKWEGWGSCRHGEIQAAVVIESGKIVSATIAQCETRYSCDVIDKLIPQVAQRQSPDIDNVSGATQSADAFSNAVFEALTKAALR